MREVHQWDRMILTPEEVHIWLMLAPKQMEVAEMVSVLDTKEQKRLAQFNSGEKQNQFLMGRWFMKQTLAQYLNVPPKQVDIDINAHGRPFLESEWDINLSHSHRAFVCVIGKGRAVGVDIEYLVRKVIEAELPHVFTPIELERLASLEGNAKKSFFFHLWTLKEAIWKAWDQGPTFPFNGFSIDIESNQCFSYTVALPSIECVLDSQLLPNYRISVAAQQFEGEFLKLRYFQRIISHA